MSVLINVLTILGICILVLVLLYLLMIMPRMLGRPDMEPFGKWLYAHRGLHDNTGDAPENSLEAFGKAIQAGFGIELDVQLAKDGVPVVFHDNTLDRVCGVQGRVSDYTYEELQQFRLCGTDQRIPRFGEVLKLVKGQVPLIVELKTETTDVSVCGAADEQLAQYQGLYCVESFNPLALFWYRKNRREIVRGQLSDGFCKEGATSLLHFSLQALLFNWLGKPDFVAYNHRHANVLSRRLCRKLYRNTAVAWTIKSPEELKAAGKDFDLFIFDSFLPEHTSRQAASGVGAIKNGANNQ